MKFNIKENIKKYLDWHIFPVDLSILSIYEVIIYILIFSYFIYLYINFQNIPHLENKVLVHPINRESNDSLYLKITFTCPSSFIFDADGQGRVKASFIEENKEKGYDLPQIATDKATNNNINDLRKTYIDLCNKYLDSIRIKYALISDIVYCKHTFNHSAKKNKYKNSQWEHLQAQCFGTTVTDSSGLSTETFLPIQSLNTGSELLITDSILPFSRPKWYDLFDISQSYYTFEFDGEINKGEITIDFEGATRFSNIFPEPDKKTMSSITFADSTKVRYIFEKGLTFHALHLEMDGIQRSRMFVITTILGTLLALFITFVVISIYKIGLKFKSSKSNQEMPPSTPVNQIPKKKKKRRYYKRPKSMNQGDK